MNFLAHLFLSGDDEEIIVGNLIEDYVVGKVDHPRNMHYPQTIKDGILLHRLIDSYTDTHPVVSACKSILYKKYHKYAAVVIDIYFDHYIAKHWILYSNEAFEDFRYKIHQAYLNHWDILPDKMKPMIESMIKHDWLKNYGEFWGIERALISVSNKTAFNSYMENALDELKTNYAFFDENFKVFFPQMIRECTYFLQKNHYTYKTIIVN